MIVSNNMNLKKLDRDFYERETLDVAKELLGKILIHNINGNLLAARITETEAYKENDKASHFYGGKRTTRTDIVFGRGGFAYVYLIYGIYYCFNVVTEIKGIPGAVLIRKVEPVVGTEEMIKNRNMQNKKSIKNLTDGPGKLCMAMMITKKQNGEDLTKDTLFIAEDVNFCLYTELKCGKRINIDYAEECKDYFWRFNI